MDRPFNINRPFDRLAVESVLYQIFHVTMGSWSDPSERDYHFDPEFWLRAEKLLAQSVLFPAPSVSTNSPVLGLPLALFKLVLSIKQLWRSPIRHDGETLDELKVELDEWERVVVFEDQNTNLLSAMEELSYSDHLLYEDATRLYVLVSSLLIKQLYDDSNPGAVKLHHPAPKDSWQVAKAVDVLRRHQDDDDWARCYIGNWPVYSLGFFANSPEDISVIRNDMQRRWDLMRSCQLERFRNDVEATWAERGIIA